jgi:hypothetical protein
MCGPHFCSMRITEDVRKYAAEQGIRETDALEVGLKDKAKAFREKGAEVYARADRFNRNPMSSVFLTTERPIFCADEAGTASILARDTVGSCRRRNESDRAPRIGSRPECKLWSLRRRTDGLSSFAAWPKKR